MALVQIAEEFLFLKRAGSLRTDSRRAPSVQTKIERLKEISTFSNIGSQFRFMANQLH